MSRTNPDDDLNAVRHYLGSANPVPDVASAVTPPAASAFEPPPVLLTSLASVRTNPRRLGPAIAVAGIAASLVVAAIGVSIQSHPRTPIAVTTGAATGPGAPAVASAYSATVHARSARAQISTDGAGGAKVVATAIGDLGSGEGLINIDNGPSGKGPAEIVSTGDAYYVRVASLGESSASTKEYLGNKPWIKVDRASLQQFLIQFSAMRNTGAPTEGTLNVFTSSLDPTQALTLLKGVSGPLTTVPGADVLHGATTTHYHAVIDLAKVAATGPALFRDPRLKAVSAANRAIPTDVWVDAQGRLRKLSLSFDAKGMNDMSGGTGGVPSTLTLEVWDFGVKVSPTAPPADQVSDLGSLTSMLARLHPKP